MLTVAVNVLIPLIFRAGEQQLHHRLVDAPRTETAAERQDHGTFVQSKRTAGAFAVCPQNLLPHRVAGNRTLCIRSHILLRVLHRQHHTVHFTGKELVRHARVCVLLVDQGWNPQFDRLTNDRAADIAARADAQVRLEFAQNAP